MSVAINFVIFPISSQSEVCIRSCRFHATAGPGTRVSLTCVARYSPDHHHKALTCKSYNRVKSRVSHEENGSRNHIKFPAFENWLRARLLQCVCYWDTHGGQPVGVALTFKMASIRVRCIRGPVERVQGNVATRIRPCFIRPKPDLDFKIRILKPWGCKQTESWIRIRFLENKCKIWI